MNFFRKNLNIFSLLICLVLLFFDITIWESVFFGWFIFLVFIINVGYFWRIILNKLFFISKNSFIGYFFSYLVSFLFLTLVGSIFLVFYSLNNILIFLSYFIVSFFTLLVYLLSLKCDTAKENDLASEQRKFVFWSGGNIMLLVYFIIWVTAFVFLYSSRSTLVLNSPWQTISKYYLPLFFFLTVLSGLFVFSKLKVRMVILVLIFQSFLLHSYLPLSHEMPWGGDVWRHLANESKIQSGELVLPVLFGEEAKWREVAGVDVPEAFLIPQKYSYGQTWSANLILAETTHIDLIWTNKWLLPILWGLFIPLIFFRIGWLLFDNRRVGLLLSWLSFLPYSLQAQGSLTLPVSLGFLSFFFFLMLWLQYLRDDSKYQKYLLWFFIFLMLFGYSLVFILAVLIILFTFIFKKIDVFHFQTIIKKWSYYFIRGFRPVIFGVSIFILPAIEIFSGFSKFPEKILWFENFKQMVGQFSGWFFSTAIRPHTIPSGNLIFNHTPEISFVMNIFTSWRWWLIPAMIVLWFSVIYGFVVLYRRKELKTDIILFLTTTSLGGYIISWFVLEGDRILSRRLNILIVFEIIVFLVFVFYKFINKIFKFKYTKVLVFIFIILFGWFITFTYATGPDLRVVGVDEYGVANYIWENLQSVSHDSGSKACILADTWVLLPLESLSSGKVVGGGFPIDYNFGQPERIKYLEKFNNLEIKDQDLQDILSLSGVEYCFYVVQTVVPEKIEKYNLLFGSEPKKIQEYNIWNWGLKKVQ